MNVGDISITSLETITAFSVGDNAQYLFTLDELQNTTISQTQEKTDITGKQGRKLNSLKRNKAVTISGTNGLISGGLLEMQTGGQFEQKATEVMWVDYLTVKSNSADLTHKAIGTAGAQIDGLYIHNTDGTLGTKYEQVGSADTLDTGKFTYTTSSNSNKITFKSGELTDGTEIVVYYKRKINASVLTNMSDQYSGKATLYIDAIGEDKCSNVYRIQILIPKADFNGEFSFEMGDNQSVHNFEAESLAGSSCGLGSAGQLWTYTIFGVDEKDAT